MKQQCVLQGRICFDNSSCCHNETGVVDRAYSLNLRTLEQHFLIHFYVLTGESNDFCGSNARGHAGVIENERADRLASTADITSGLQLDRVQMLRGFRNFLNIGRPEYHRSDRWTEKRSRQRSGRPTFHPPRSETICVQPDKHWHCFEGSLWSLLRDGAELFRALRYHLEQKLKLEKAEIDPRISHSRSGHPTTRPLRS